MNNLHRQLAPISEAAWGEIDQEARRTFIRWIAGRRVVDVVGPDGEELAAVRTGHQVRVDTPFEGVQAHQRQVRQIVELRVPFRVSREAVDAVDRGAQDSDWQPVKDAVAQIARAEDGIVFDGLASAGIEGLVPSSSNPAVSLPQPKDLPDAVAAALKELRLAGVEGPYALLLSAELWTAVAETTDDGYPIRKHIDRPLEGEVLWAPAIQGAVLLSTRGGDYELHLGQDLSIGYLSHDAESIELYLQETLTFLPYTSEASVVLSH